MAANIDDYKATIRQLKKSSNTAVFNALVAIRTKFVKEAEGVARLRQHGGLQLLLYHLQRPNFKIVELALSILGNCCMERETREEIRNLKGIRHIVLILESIDKDSILNRACRTLANLALDDRNAEEILERNAAKLLVDLLGTATDASLKLSALRALRILANTSRHRAKVNAAGGTECLAKILTLGGSGDDGEVLHSALRALSALTTECTQECARQMENVEYLERLVSSAKDSSAQLRDTSLHILSNLCKQETLRPVLGNAGIVSVLVVEVAKWEKSSSGWQWAVDALCQCTREAINRVRLRTEGGLQHLVSLLREDESDERLWLRGLSALVNFLYDDISFAQLIELGLVPALAGKLAVLAAREPAAVHGPPTCPAALVTAAQMQGSYSSVASPQSGSFSPDCSPPYWTAFPRLASPLMSPTAVSPRSDHPDQAGGLCYSPVYEWEDSEEEEEASSSSRGTASLPELDALDRSDELEEEEELKTPADGRSPLGDVLLLFSRLTMQEDPCPGLLGSGAFAALLEYAAHSADPIQRARRCILRTVRNALCFERLVLHRVPSQIFEGLVETPHAAAACSACAAAADLGRVLITDLRLQAESAFGTGVILHLLLGKSDDRMKLSAAMAAALVLRSEQVRRKVFVDSIGLQPLTSALGDSGEDTDRAVGALCHLARTVLAGAEGTAEDTAEDHDPVSRCSYEAGASGPDVVLRAGGQDGVAVSRQLLCAQSEVFDAMLNGGFAESGQDSVVIRDASLDTLRCAAHFVHSCRAPGCPALRDASRAVPLLLDLMALADKFLLEPLKKTAAGMVKMTNPGTEDLALVLAFAKMVDGHGLRRWALARLLTANGAAEDRRQRFRYLVECDGQLPEDLSAFLAAEMGSRT